MWVSKIRKEELTNDVVDRLLFEGLHDNGASVDCIIFSDLPEKKTSAATGTQYFAAFILPKSIIK